MRLQIDFKRGSKERIAYISKIDFRAVYAFHYLAIRWQSYIKSLS